MKSPYLSIVVPAFNEEVIIEKNLGQIVMFLKNKKYTWEIIVVDDGSTDNSLFLASIFQKKHKLKNLKIIFHKQNLGKGAAVRTGMLAAHGEFIIFMDADLSVPLKYIDEIIKALQHSDVAIGSRRVRGSVIKKHQPFLRKTMGRAFTKLTQFMIWSDIADFTCGFKGFRNGAARAIFEKGKIDRWAYDAEILFLAERLRFKIAQVPVSWINREQTRVRLGRAVFESLIDLIRIRVFLFMRKYEK